MKIVIDSTLCLLGIFVYFLNRYANRTIKANLSLKYWWKDNWPEFLSTIALNAALMVIIHLSGTVISLPSPVSSMTEDVLPIPLPIVLKVAGIPTMSFLLGLGLTHWFYTMFKKKIAKSNGNVDD